MTTAGARRSLLVPEVVQTSAMDCGPAALKCLLEGFGLPVSYGRLREACQTDVDGTSIDAIEVVANHLGLDAEQMVLPTDHVFLRRRGALPALIVVLQPGGGTHFVVVWRRLGGWLQVMDPAVGRRWVRTADFASGVYCHATSVPVGEWRTWAGSEAFLGPLQERMMRLGAVGGSGAALRDRALADRGWFGLGALDAGVRLVQSLTDAGGIAAGPEAARLLHALLNTTLANERGIFSVIPPWYWAVSPDPESTGMVERRLVLRGAVLLHVTGRRPGNQAGSMAEGPPLSVELAAALQERPTRPFRALLNFLRDEGVLRPAALVTATAVCASALLVENLLLRALLDVSDRLNLNAQRLAALGAILMFMAVRLIVQAPVVTEAMRLGRHLEVQLRMALLRKMPKLADRYFQSRPISDMADRAHSIHTVRQLPTMIARLLQALCELLVTLGGIIIIDPRAASLAVSAAVAAIGIPVGLQPLLKERDLRVRNHGGALSGFYLDALLGLVPIRVHRAERAVQRRHEGLLVEWARASRRRLVLLAYVGGLQSLLCGALAGWLLFDHFTHAGNVTGSDLLLVYWTLRLPAIGLALATVLNQLPAQQNTVARLLEPMLAAEEEVGAASARPNVAQPRAAAIAIGDGSVVVAGHEILRDLNLTIEPGEHIAVVGASGAGKSTLIGLLLGWYRLSTGALCVDGAPMPGGASPELRRSTAWVDPAIQIWNRSFADNIAYGTQDWPLARVGEAADAASLSGVLRNLPDGMQTRLGEGGALVSGGEGQRVRFARALAQSGVRLALLDEPFRGLDRDQRSALLATARKRWHDVTMLCVTHDIGETQIFDRVLVIDGGRIVEDDQPARLAAAPSRYRELLEAEREILGELWRGVDWRRIVIRGGRAHEAA